ncbi:hypothetical protein MmiEs2_11520 [Methanimicrococcus stummii]|uniref:DUF262 domain-containing protein n=1 Tax=Methanimicrococcus stummii TaxID=3028294 RepID=A0AA96ZXG5_9EURY|nr:DUF262 domain-containing protein [Methanimicrococcus sp. Es2]WNY28939.1 hypothetical protein MmiEs2_11520 [Methanimicrococcus sp. Es2]
MKAVEVKIEKFLDNPNTQFIIPVYQRNYDWTKEQCKQLLDDVLEVGSSEEMSSHFIGSIVFIHDDVYTSSGIRELTIIDGQQRLTTLTLIYLEIYKLMKELKNENLENRIYEMYLINKFAPEDKKLKLKPTENNEKVLKYLLRDCEDEEYSEFSKMIDNFNYLRGRITEENYQTVLKGLSKLVFVEVSLDREKDDPQRIFESLNSTGLELTQADLIRNYILMRMNRQEQTKIYQDYWEIIEKQARDESSNMSLVSDFIRDYLTLENKKIPNKGKVYSEFKARYPENTLEDLEIVLKQMKSLAKHYNKLVNPKNESDKDVRKQLEYINKLEINVAYPFLMKVYDDYSKGVIDKTIFINVLELIQSFTWRRFILSLPTNALNKIFMNLYEKVDENDYLYSIQKSLLQRKGVQRFPRDIEVIDALKIKDVYNIKSKNRTYLLERLENFENKEPVMIEGNSDITIEHIFPQNPDSKWKTDLGFEEYNEIKENYLNTIGNLTLSGNNGKLGNKSFIEKRDLPGAGYSDSRFWLNKYIANLDKWNMIEIEKRFKLISERFLRIWKIPSIDLNENAENDEINIFDAEEPQGKKLEYAIFFDQRIEINQISKLYVEILKQLFDLQPETFFTTDLAEKICLVKTSKEGSLKQPVAINETYSIEGTFGSNKKFDRIKYALTVFNLEEELMIKYSGTS